jgi:Haem-binding domain
MKPLVLTIVFLMLALIAFAGSLSRKQNGRVSAKANDYRNVEPFRGSEVGNTLARACGDCHSNQTRLPWYGHVAPISWWIQSHVREGREELNFSEWTRYTALQRHNELESICGVVSNGRMPPASYTALHPEASLGAQDKKAVCFWAVNEIEEEK